MNQRQLEGALIAFVHQSADLYGSDKVLLDLAQEVQGLGGRPVVLIPETGPLVDELARRNIEYHVVKVLKITRAHFGPIGILRLIKESMFSRKAMDSVFRGRRVHLVHSNTLAVLGGALWARRHKIPHLWHVHEIIVKPALAARLFSVLLKLWADKVVCNSEATRNWLLTMQPTLSGKSIVVVNGVRGPSEMDLTKIADLRAAFRPEGVAIAIGLIGRINRWKGQTLLMDAADELFRRGQTDFSVIFVGSPPPSQDFFETALRERISKSPMRARVRLLGYTPDVWSVYSALDVVCVPSIDPEPFGLVAVEAMIMSKPVVASRFGGLTEIVVNGETGITFSPGSASQLADALQLLITRANLRESMGSAAHTRYRSTFSANAMLDRFAVLYSEMITCKAAQTH